MIEPTFVFPTDYFTMDIDFNMHTVLLLVVLVPSLLLYFICAALVLRAKTLHWTVRYLLVNIFTANILQWVTFIMLFLEWPQPLDHVKVNKGETCSMAINFNVAFIAEAFSSITVYGFVVLVFLKHGDTTLFKSVVCPLIFGTWTATIFGNFVSCHPVFGIFNVHAHPEWDCQAFQDYKVYVLGPMVVSVSCIVVLTIATHGTLNKQVRKNIVMRKALMNTLYYYGLVSFATLVYGIVPDVFSTIRDGLADNGIISPVLTNYLLVLLSSLPSLLNPLAVILILKPAIRADLVRSITSFKRALYRIYKFCYDTQIVQYIWGLYDAAYERHRIFPPRPWYPAQPPQPRRHGVPAHRTN